MRFSAARITHRAIVSYALLACVYVQQPVAFAQDSDAAETADASSAPLKGVVRFDGPRPKRRPIRMFEKGGKPSDCAKMHKTPLLEENLLVSEEGTLANAFVYIKRGVDKKEFPVPDKAAVLDQKDCMFRPRIQGIRVGQELRMRNSDGVLHNVRSFAFRNRAFNIAQPAGTPDRSKVFKTGEGPVRIMCDIHPWMNAFIFVLDHPFFAVTNSQGEYSISGLPPGEYTVAAWHEEFGEQRSKITVQEGVSTEIGFIFKPKER